LPHSSRLSGEPEAWSRRTQPYITLNDIFAQPHLPPIRLRASASLSPVVGMAVDGIGVASIPPAIVADELRPGQLRIIPTEARIPELSFTASWPTTPDSFAAEELADIGVSTADEYQRGRSQ
jgi:DNA-binding transcriptional LysR family regulator